MEATDFLFRRGEHVDAPRPDLVILDLPRKDGKEVLAEIKGEPMLRSIPIAILTTSEEEADILASYDLGLDCYLTEPVGLEQFLRLVQSMEEFWLALVRLPRQEGLVQP